MHGFRIFHKGYSNSLLYELEVSEVGSQLNLIVMLVESYLKEHVLHFSTCAQNYDDDVEKREIIFHVKKEALIITCDTVAVCSNVKTCECLAFVKLVLVFCIFKPKPEWPRYFFIGYENSFIMKCVSD